MMATRVNITDRAHRYRAQNAVTGPRKCVLCGSTRNLDVMHLDGNESHGESSNLAYGCRSCNGKLAAAFKRIGKGRPTNQYNPAKGAVPTFAQYAWAVSSGAREYYPNSTRHAHGVEDEAGAVIHATPHAKRVEYAREIARRARSTRQVQSQERWNPSAAEVNREFAKENGKRRLMGLPALTKRDFVYQWYPELFKSNPWPFSRPKVETPKRAKGARRPGGGLSLREAGVAAFKAGRKSGDLSDFDGWLDRKRMSEQSDGFISRIRDDYKRGVASVEAEQENREFLKRSARDKREAERESARGSGRRSKAKESSAPFYASAPNEETIQRGLKAGKTLNEILRGNPAAGAVKGFEDFHGFKPSRVTTITKEIHHHEHLSEAGKLVSLDVWGIDGRGHKISGFRGAFLAFNEDRNQLFVEGGDQSIDLKTYGITRAHELETLGELTDVAYQTDKTHLGDEGGQAVYVHKFRSTNENGKHVVVKIARYPDLIYDVRNEQLLFSGGSYEILREGIDK